MNDKQPARAVLVGRSSPVWPVLFLSNWRPVDDFFTKSAPLLRVGIVFVIAGIVL